MLTKVPNERALFEQALDLGSEAERAKFLSEQCGDDTALKERLERLLSAEEQPTHFLPPTPESNALALPELSPDEEIGTFIGPYKLLEKIGEGGWGVVYMAEQEEPVSRRVALKIIRLGMDSKQVIARFEVERQALAMMNHQSIAKVLDAGTTDTGRPYFVMELVRGVPISTYCDDNKLPTAERLKLFIEVCHAVQHAHQKGIIHRDIKPSNILVTMHDHKAVPKIIDFGIAKATQQKLTKKTLFTQFQQFIGTPAYMSPEQAQMSGLDLDTRTDIYSLGVLLYELLTGYTPLDAKELSRSDYDEMRRKIREEDPLVPSTRLNTMGVEERTTVAKRRHIEPARLNRLVKGELDWIVMKAIEKDRNRRYETATEFALDVQRYLDLEPVKAVAPSRFYRLQKMVRRHRGACAAAALIVVSLVMGISVSSWLAVRATRAEAAADQAAEKAVFAQSVAEDSAREATQQRNRASAAAVNLQQNLYASDMYVAQQFLAQDNIAKVRELLEKHVPKAGEPDYRGFEWRYLWDRSRGDELYVFPGHDQEVGDVSFSASGRWLASYGEDQMVRVWDVATKDLVVELERPVRRSFRWLRVMFSPDDRYLVAGPVFSWRRGGEVTVWDVATWEPVTRLRDFGFPLRFDDDGSHIIGASKNGFGQCDLENKPHTLEPFGTPIELTKDLRGYSWTPDRELIALRDDITRVWSFETGELVWEGRTRDVRFALSSDFEYFASTPDGWMQSVSELQVQLYQVDGQRRIDLEQVQPGFLHALEFSEDSSWLVAGGWDYLIHVWEPRSGRKVGVLKGQLDEVFTLAFSPNNQSLASAGKDGRVYLWDVRALQPREEFERIDYLPLTSRSGQEEKPLRSRKDLKRVVPPELYAEFNSGQLDYYLPYFGRRRSEVLSSDGRFVADRVDKNRIELWDLASGKYRATIEIPETHNHWFRGTNRGFVGANLLVYNAGPKLQFWDIERNRIHRTGIPAKYEAWKGASVDGRYLAILQSSDDTRITVWDLETDQKRSDFYGLNHSPSSVVFSPDNRWAAATSWDKRSFIWDVNTGAVVHELTGHKQGIASAAFSHDGKTFATSSPDGVIRLWHLASGREMLSFNPAEAQVWKLSFSSDDGTLLLQGFSNALFLRVPDLNKITAASVVFNGDL